MGAAAKRVAEHASALARLELELAQLELKRKAGALGFGAGLGLAAAVLALFAFGFGLATAAAALALVLDTWLALLIVFAGLLVLTGLLAVLALGLIRRGTPPVPEQAIEEAVSRPGPCGAMARNGRTAEDVRRDIALEREQLAGAVDELRADFDVADMLRAKLPALATGALGAGFVLFGGVGAAMRLLARRGREGKEKARVGPFSFVRR